jgi:NADH:ubiquinone reductase (H+-translocating)
MPRAITSVQEMSNSPKKRILILGGGFAGLYAAMELEKTLAWDPDVTVTLVNRENFFLFTPMLHEVAASDLDLTTIVSPEVLRGSLQAGENQAN